MKEINLKVEGMVCSGCENRVKNALKELSQVEDVIASHEEGNVIITLKDEVDTNILKEVIEELGFDVL